MRVFARVALAAILFCGASGQGLAAEEQGDAAQRDFVARYVAAIKAQDVDALRKLYHPAVLACIKTENREYFDFLFGKELSYAPDLGNGYTLTRIAPVDPGQAAGFMSDLLPNPVKATHQFQIDTPLDAKNHSLGVIRTIAMQGGAWYIVTGCPTEKAVQIFHERQAEGAQQREAAKQRVAELQEPLRTELKDLLVQHRKIAAINRYKEAAATDTTTAVQVIDILDAD